MWSRFLPLARQSILVAQNTATAGGETAVRNVHLLLGLVSSDEMHAVRRLREAKVDVELLCERLSDLPVPTGLESDGDKITLSSDAKLSIDETFQVASRSGSQFICTGCLLCGVVQSSNSELTVLLTELGITRTQFYSVEPLRRDRWFRRPRG
jgi:ATP-dependent Clp protease ATP-binding subunit ClpA